MRLQRFPGAEAVVTRRAVVPRRRHRGIENVFEILVLRFPLVIPLHRVMKCANVRMKGGSPRELGVTEITEESRGSVDPGKGLDVFDGADELFQRRQHAVFHGVADALDLLRLPDFL